MPRCTKLRKVKNKFDYVAYSGREHAPLNITPRVGKQFDQTEINDRNIRFVNNIITTFDSRIVWADRVDGLLIKGNTITKTTDQPALFPEAPIFEFTHSKNVVLDTINNYM